jgi:hypothetical protein
METIIHTTAVLSNRGYYENIGITEKSAILYGCDASQIEHITFEVSEDQSEAKPESITMEYWGWFDNRVQDWTLIFPTYYQLCVCFPYELSELEEYGHGKAYRLNLVK